MFYILSTVTTQELEDIYELTYKLQMLEQEQALGDYGIPQTLPDPAYMEIHKMEGQLAALLESAKNNMVATYGDWLEDHFGYAMEQAREDVAEFSDEPEDEDEDVVIERADQYLEDGAYYDVQIMQMKLSDEWQGANLSDKIIMFQEALTTMHNNGSMAAYLLDDQNAVQILDDLSAGPEVPYWNRDLANLLGYEIGTRSAPRQEWFSPVPALAKVIAVLGRLCRSLSA